MIIVDDVLITDSVLNQPFACNLDACKGACCVEGDGGAPLDDDEVAILAEIYPKIAPYLHESGKAVIAAQGTSVRGSDGEIETPLVEGKACAYAIFTENGTALCGIEQAWQEGAVSFRKPISCHLYPIRVHKSSPFDVLQYHQWNICAPACANGQKRNSPIFRFAKEALIRKYGAEWYETLEAAISHEAGDSM